MPSDRSKILSSAQRLLVARAAIDPQRRLVCPPNMPSDSFGRTVQSLASRGFVRGSPSDQSAGTSHLRVSEREYVLSLVGLALIAAPPYSELVSDDPVPGRSGGPALTDLTVVAGSSEEPRQSRQDQIVALLSRPEGASVPALMAATGWLPHTTRAALSGLRKKGFRLERTVREGEAAVYHIRAEQRAA